MGRRRGGRSVRVAGRDRGQDRLVLVERTVLTAWRTEGCGADQEQHAAQIDEELRHAAVATGGGLDVGELRQTVEERGPVAHGERPEALVDRPLEGPQDLRRPSLGEIPRDAALEQETQLEDLTHVLRRGLCHASPSIRLDRDQPVALEPDEGFANGVLETPSSSAMRASTSCAPGWSSPETMSSRRRSYTRRSSCAGTIFSRAGSVMHRASYIAA